MSVEVMLRARLCIMSTSFSGWTEKPSMGYLYEVMDSSKAIQKSFNENE